MLLDCHLLQASCSDAAAKPPHAQHTLTTIELLQEHSVLNADACVAHEVIRCSAYTLPGKHGEHEQVHPACAAKIFIKACLQQPFLHESGWSFVHMYALPTAVTHR